MARQVACQVGVDHPGKKLGSVRPLERQHRRRRLPVEQLYVHVRLDERSDAISSQLNVRGVVHHQEAHCIQAIDENVIEDATVVVAEQRVVGVAFAELVHLVGERAPQQPPGVVTDDEESTHVGDVEDADPLADGPVLLDDAGVLERHLPAGEGGETRTKRSVLRIEGKLAKRGRGHASGSQCRRPSSLRVR